MDWSNPRETAWLQVLEGMQRVTGACDTWIGCFPSSTLEPKTFDAVKKDKVITRDGTILYHELGWNEVGPGQEWDPGLKAFLDKHEPRNVTYIRLAVRVRDGD